MAKALKPLIIILLVLSIASLVLGIMLYGKREILKGRVVRLEESTTKIAGSIQHSLNASSIKNYGTMLGALNNLNNAAKVLYTTHEETKADLENTRQELVSTQDELLTAQNDLSKARDKVQDLEVQVADAEEEAATAKLQMEKFEEDNQVLQGNIDTLKGDITKMTQEHQDTLIDLETYKADYAACQIELRGEDRPIVKGLDGKVLYVNDEWNFLVVNIGSKEGLVQAAEMLVQRGDVLVARIKVSNVKDTQAVADVISGTQQSPIQLGDRVISPKS